jgi:DNA-binding NarL/FixJ family response regulator
MEHIQVIIADLSQLSRLGFISLLDRMKYPFSIREVSAPERLAALLSREPSGLLAISSSFLQACPTGLIHQIHRQIRGFVSILIKDTASDPDVSFRFTESIESSDPDRIIIRKLEKQLSLLYSQTQEEQGPEEISDREKEVLRLVAIGLTNKEIADKLFISSHTVITHRKNITAKLGIKTIAGLTMYALINHIIVPEEKR